jgi:hypothetical protein
MVLMSCNNFKTIKIRKLHVGFEVLTAVVGKSSVVQ